MVKSDKESNERARVGRVLHKPTVRSWAQSALACDLVRGGEALTLWEQSWAEIPRGFFPVKMRIHRAGAHSEAQKLLPTRSGFNSHVQLCRQAAIEEQLGSHGRDSVV